MIFLPKCRPFNVVLEKGHGTGKKGKALEKRGMAQRKAKIGQGKHYFVGTPEDRFSLVLA